MVIIPKECGQPAWNSFNMTACATLTQRNAESPWESSFRWDKTKRNLTREQVLRVLLFSLSETLWQPCFGAYFHISYVSSSVPLRLPLPEVSKRFDRASNTRAQALVGELDMTTQLSWLQNISGEYIYDYIWEIDGDLRWFEQQKKTSTSKIHSQRGSAPNAAKHRRFETWAVRAHQNCVEFSPLWLNPHLPFFAPFMAMFK